MKAAIVALALASVNADMYLQDCRGSNNRLDERGRERANQNRLFDSQNNNRGGYNVGHLTYYTGEKVPISWTNQHGSGKYQLKETEIVLQYTCGELMRDGTTTNRIPDNPTQCQDFNCDTDVEYGRHESWESYQYCKASSRNKGLFTANQNLNNRESAIYTRQDSKGTRYGYECPEERDYYPYWRGSMWRDMAVYTNTVERCPAYQAESQNVKTRGECKFTDAYWNDMLNGYVSQSNGELPLNEYDCSNSDTAWYENTAKNQTLYKWEWVDTPSFGLGDNSLECKQTRTTRANHHGLPGDRRYWTHEWTVPDSILDIPGHDQCCVIRARYNITTDEYQAWDSDTGIGAGLDSGNNSRVTNPDPDDDPAWVKIWEDFGLTYEDIEESFLPEGNPNADNANQKQSRGYVFRDDPEVDPFGYDPLGGSDGESSRILLELAIDTSQFGRTFQDRTHCFHVKDRTLVPGVKADDAITLVTVQGKRGNIVQVYPATEYFFIPEPAVIYADSYIHFCWTGSNRNPQNNDGQGLQGSDRSNICPLTAQQWDKEAGGELGDYGNVDGFLTLRAGGAVGDPGNNYPDWIREPSYGMPVYYSYAPKRDIPRKAAGEGHCKTESCAKDEFNTVLDYPYNDPYNQFWFNNRGDVSQMAGLSNDVLGALCTQRRVDMPVDRATGLMDFGNMEEFDDAGTTFCIEPVKARELGMWNFLCTRNNNFSNRSQKGSLIVSNAFTNKVSATSGGLFSKATSGQAKIVILPMSVKEGDSLDFDITTWLNREGESTIVQLSGSDGGEFPAEVLVDGRYIEMWVPYTGKSLSYPKAFYRSTSDEEWKEHSDASIENEAGTHYGVIQVTKGGYYTIQNKPDILAYCAIVLGVMLFGTAMFFVVKKNCVKPASS